MHIEGLDVSLWGAWPDVEVRLRGVRIADALDPEADFLTLNRLDLTVACWPLLEDRLEVRSLQLSQGQINLRRASDGTDNWVFWKTDESSEVALPAWRIESLVLDEVVVEGSWASGREVTAWSTEVQDAQLSLASGVGGALEVGGVVELVRSDLRVAEEPWLDQVGFSAEVNGRIGEMMWRWCWTGRGCPVVLWVWMYRAAWARRMVNSTWRFVRMRRHWRRLRRCFLQRCVRLWMLSFLAQGVKRTWMWWWDNLDPATVLHHGRVRHRALGAV